MPKVTKDATEIEEKDIKKVTKKSSTKKTTTKKASTAKSKTSTSSKPVETKSSNLKTKKTATSKSTRSSSATKKKTPAKVSTTKRRTTTSKVKKLDTPIVAEYYDLPYRYNQTIVKILYQTPTILFVYWDISDDDRLKFINQYGENFFNETVPVLKIHNTTLNYSFEVEINDFANSWYLNINHSNCHYTVELGRKTINNYNEYIHISSSNTIESPNDHILFEQLPEKVTFKNVKTNEISYKNVGSLKLISINKIFNVNEFYKKLYKDEVLEEFNNSKIKNPSSSSWN